MEGSVDQERRNEPKYKGVRLRKWGKWVSEVRLPNSRERIWLGSYDTAEKAARAFDAAQFCLRGPNANFNFPENPPDIPRGQSLSPAEIQVVASQFANSYQQRQDQVALPPHDDIEVMETNSHVIKIDKEEETSLSSTCNNHVGQMNTMDWSFLDMLEGYPLASGPTDAPPLSSSSPHPQLPSNESTTNFDFGYYPGLETMSSNLYSPTHFPPRTTYNNDCHENDDMSGNGDENYFQQSFLWNF